MRLVRFGDFCLATMAMMPSSILRRPAEVFRQFERVAWGGVPIAATAGLSIGFVTWLQARRMLIEYGAEASLPSVMALAVLVETGPMLASLLTAGRMGAGLGAEMGSMRLNEEVDAREVLGAPIIASLVAPRAVASMIAVPLLTVVLGASALAAALIAESINGATSPRVFAAHIFDFVRLRDVIPSTIKTAAFGLIVALVGCDAGLKADRSTDAIGRASTRGVVRSMLAIFVVNAFFVAFLRIWIA